MNTEKPDSVSQPQLPAGTEFKLAPFDQLEMRPADWAFRESEDFSDAALQSLADGIRSTGIIEPLLVWALGTAMYLVANGHRRLHALMLLIRQGVAGFSSTMLVPVHVIPQTAKELDVLTQAAAANLQRKDFSEVGRIKLATKLRSLGMSIKDIANTFGAGESTISRDIALGKNLEMLAHVEADEIGATKAAALVKAAHDAGRTDDFMLAFLEWLEETNAQITQEQARRKLTGEQALSKADTKPAKYLSSQQVDAWLQALKDKVPLTRVSSSFKFKAVVKVDKGLEVIEIDSLTARLAELSLDDTLAVYNRLGGVVEALVPVLAEKFQAAKAREAAITKASSSTGGSHLDKLREVGLGELVADATATPKATDSGSNPGDQS